MRVRPCIAMLFSLLCFSTENIASWAVTDYYNTKAFDTTIGAFEDRLFFHQYRNESVTERLSHLENSVFGTTYNGEQESERLNRIAQVLPLIKHPKGQPKTLEQQIKPTRSSAYNEYPAVVEMEANMLGRSFASEPIATRLDRLEAKQFGRKSNCTDLALRVDNLKRSQMPAALMQSVQDHIAISRLRLAPSSVLRARESRQTTVADRIEIMEKNVFGKIHPERPLQKRVTALEKNIYGAPQPQTNGALSERVVQLWMKVTGANDFRIVGSARG